jgi:peroxiredoxin
MTNRKVGDTVPTVEFKTLGENGIETLNSKVLFEGQKVLLVGVMGAFTPVCTTQHLPDFIPFASQLKENGIVDSINCVARSQPIST